MSNQLPDGLIDGRFSAVDYTESPAYSPGSSGSAAEFLEGRVAPRDKSRTELCVNEIVLAISSHQVSRYQRRTFDIFDKRWKTWTEHVVAGNRKIMWDCGGAEILNSDFDVTRESGLPADTVQMFRELGTLPGHAVTLDREAKCGRIIDLFDLSRFEDLWERLRRRAVHLRSAVFIGHPMQPIVVPLNNAADEATWEFGMRRLLGQTTSTPSMDSRVAMNFQNCDAIRSREELAASGKVRLKFLNAAQSRELERDMRLRAGRLDGGEARYRFDGYLTPALAGTDPEADLETIMPSAF